MSSRTKKSFAWLWIAALLTATVGISVQQIYCYCVGKTSVSFFNAEDACALEDQAEMPGCCEKPGQDVPSCCQKGAEDPDKDHDCTHKSTKVFQLKTEFVVDKPFEKSLDCPLWMQELPMFRRFFRPAICAAFQCQHPPPPPLSGREICLRHQLFRC